MCGICGVAFSDSAQPVDPDMLHRMTSILRHRGPDSQGFHIAPGVGLGIQRLSIIDLQTGDQPIANEDGTVTVICNGEIYNFQELRQELVAAGHRFRTGSDIEVIVHLYEEYGVECLQYLRGMFAFALWDTSRRRLMLARDRLGIKPLHYAVSADALYFGSEQKAILAAERIERRIDLHAVQDLFTFGCVLGPKTLFTKIRRLQPGYYLLYQNGVLSLRQYWDLSFPMSEEEPSRLSPEEWADSLLEQLEESVRLHLRSDVPVGAWLSAGVDSSGIAGLMSRLTNRPIQTFTLAFENLDFDEVRNQRTLDEFPGYNLPNRRVVCTTKDFARLPKALWHCEDPSTAGIGIPRLLLSEATTQDVKVVLTGEGSDEIFGGYGWFQVDKVLRPLARLPLSVRRLMLLGPLMPGRHPRASRVHLAPREMNLERYARLIAPLHTDVREQLFSTNLKQDYATVQGSDEALRPPKGFQRWHPFAQLQYYELKIRLPDYVEHNLDRESMACSLEARVPFLDHKLVEFCSRIPPALKMRRLQEKYILREALRNVLPPEIAQRKKRGLAAPFQQWLRAELPDFAAELLSENQLRQKGYFHPDFVAVMRAQHSAGRDSYSSPLMGVLIIQLWDELFLRGRLNGSAK